MECIKCYYESMILEQQISYAVLESEYANLRGDEEVVTESELSSKVGEKFKMVLSTISKWITNILNFVTKTIPAFIKGVVQKISDKIHKREKNKKVVNASALPKEQQSKVESIAASINSNNKLGRKIENQIDTSEIKKELDNATKTDSSSDNNTVANKKEENIKKATETYNENKKKIEEEISKVEDSSVKAELTEANNKKEEVVVKTEKEPKFVGYKGMYMKYEDKVHLNNALRNCNVAFDSLFSMIDNFNERFFVKYPDETPEEIEYYKVGGRNRLNRMLSNGRIDKDTNNVTEKLNELKTAVNNVNIIETTLDKLPKTKYIEDAIDGIKKSEKFILSVKKSITTASKKQKITNNEALLLTKFFNIVMPVVNRYVREMTYAYTFKIKTMTSFCDNAVAVYE